MDGLTDLRFVVWEKGDRYVLIAVALEDLLYFRARHVLALTQRCAVADLVSISPSLPGRGTKATIPVMISTLTELMSDSDGVTWTGRRSQTSNR